MKTKGGLTRISKAGVAIYAASALGFLFELLGEVTGISFFSVSWLAHELIAIFTFLGFILGAILIWRSHLAMANRNIDLEKYVQVAKGDFFVMLEQEFERWGLTDAEKDVALLTIKGMTLGEIAILRNTSEGTIKSQNNAIYRKAKVKTRTQLLSVLIDELVAD